VEETAGTEWYTEISRSIGKRYIFSKQNCIKDSRVTCQTHHVNFLCNFTLKMDFNVKTFKASVVIQKTRHFWK
jgi:hypothetical protein